MVAMRRLPLLLCLLSALAIITSACGDANLDEILAETIENTQEEAGTSTEPASGDDERTTDEPSVTEPATDGEIAGAPAGQQGDRSNPVAAGTPADLGDGWRVQILGVTDDATRQILSENQFNDPPPTGSRFTIVRVAIGYYGTTDPVQWWDVTVSAVADGLELSTDCGVIPDEKPFGSAYSGAVWEGNVCFVTEGPLGDVTLYTEEFFSFDSDRVFMALADNIDVAPLQPRTGPQPGADSTDGRLKPSAAGTSVQISDDWQITLSNGRIGTAEVMALNQFNDGPPDGHDFYLVDMAARYDGDETGTIFDLTITGATDSNVGLDNWCGTHPNDFEFGLEAFPGGTLEGTHCVVVPTAEADSLVFDISESFDFESNHSFFAPN